MLFYVFSYYPNKMMRFVFKDPNTYLPYIKDLKPLVKTKILSVDIGTKKHGVAVSCLNMIFSHPLQTVSNYDEIYRLFLQNNCKTLIVGYPFTTNDYQNDPESKICSIINNFVDNFTAKFSKVAVFYVDENFSSFEVANQLAISTKDLAKKGVAKKGIAKKSKIYDSNVAAYLLQDFLKLCEGF